MKKVVFAISPLLKKSKNLDSFIGIIQLFQNQGLFSQVTLTSVVHSSLYGVPNSWFYKNEKKYEEECRQRIWNVLDGEFKFEAVKVLSAVGSSNHYLVEQVEKYAKKNHNEALLVMSNEKEGRPHWLLGSFAESAVLTSKLPVWVIKPQLKLQDLAKKPRIVLALDGAVSYTVAQIKWIKEFASTINGHIDIVFVEKKPSRLADTVFASKKKSEKGSELRVFEKIKSTGLSVSLHIVKEKISVAETIVDFSDKVKAWTIVTIVEEKNLTKKLLLGSVSRRVLMLTKRPYLNLAIK